MKSVEETHAIDAFIKKVNDYRIDQVHTYGLDIDANHIYLVGEESYISGGFELESGEPGVEYLMASRFIKNLNILMRKSSSPILIHMKTCGGAWEEGMAIYDAIKACPNPTTILNYTHARSMSSIIFQAANKRVMLPHSSFLIHQGTAAYSGTVKQFMSFAEWYKLSDPIMLRIYSKSMRESGIFKGKPKEEITKYLLEKMDAKEDVYWGAKKTVQLGLADEIFGEGGRYDWARLIEYTEEELSR